jgi:hypothetical protein
MVGEAKNLPEWAEEIPDALPHGSGIDADWYIEYKHGYIRCDNSYHCMNEDGYYDGWQDFSVILRKDNRDNGVHVTIHFHNGHYKADRYMLKEYLGDTVAEMLSDLVWGKGFKKVLRSRDAWLIEHRIKCIQDRIQPYVISGKKSFVDLSEAMNQLEQLKQLMK